MKGVFERRSLFLFTTFYVKENILFFNSFLFAYTILRKPGDRHEILVRLPSSWLWKATTYRVVGLDQDYVVVYDRVEISRDRLRFLVEDGLTINLIIYYKGWFNALRVKEITIPVPIRIKGVTGLSFEVVKLQNRYI